MSRNKKSDPTLAVDHNCSSPFATSGDGAHPPIKDLVMSLSNALTNTGVILLLVAMTIAMFCGLQRDELSGKSGDTDATPELFEARLSDAMPADQANRVLISIELLGELLFMLAMATGISGIGLSVIEGIGNLFQELVSAIRRLFVIRRESRNTTEPNPRYDRDDDMAQSLVTRPFAPIPPTNPMPSRPLINRSRAEALVAI